MARLAPAAGSPRTAYGPRRSNGPARRQESNYNAQRSYHRPRALFPGHKKRPERREVCLPGAQVGKLKGLRLTSEIGWPAERLLGPSEVSRRLPLAGPLPLPPLQAPSPKSLELSGARPLARCGRAGPASWLISITCGRALARRRAAPSARPRCHAGPPPVGLFALDVGPASKLALPGRSSPAAGRQTSAHASRPPPEGMPAGRRRRAAISHFRRLTHGGLGGARSGRMNGWPIISGADLAGRRYLAGPAAGGRQLAG